MKHRRAGSLVLTLAIAAGVGALVYTIFGPGTDSATEAAEKNVSVVGLNALVGIIIA